MDNKIGMWKRIDDAQNSIARYRHEVTGKILSVEPVTEERYDVYLLTSRGEEHVEDTIASMVSRRRALEIAKEYMEG